MHFDWLVPALLAVLVVITFWIALRRPPVDSSVERQARELRDEVLRSAQGTRQELGGTLAEFQRTLLAQQNDTARTQNEQIDSFSRQLVAMQQHLVDSLARTSATQVEQARLARESLDTTHSAQGARQAASLKELAESLGEQLRALVAANDQRMAEVKATVETRLSEPTSLASFCISPMPRWTCSSRSATWRKLSPSRCSSASVLKPTLRLVRTASKVVGPASVTRWSRWSDSNRPGRRSASA